MNHLYKLKNPNLFNVSFNLHVKRPCQITQQFPTNVYKSNNKYREKSYFITQKQKEIKQFSDPFLILIQIKLYVSFYILID